MTRARIELDIVSYWHAGTGRGAGPELDAVCQRTADGLPVLPGRTLRGLLRDALAFAVEVGEVDPRSWPDEDPVAWCFGTGLDGTARTDRVDALEEARFRTDAGKLHVSSAVLGHDEHTSRDWARWARANPSQVEHLFRPFASTKVDDDGTAADHTLRAIEVAVPMTLRAEVAGPDDGPPWRAALASAAGFVRGLGSHRNRGLGRVKVTVKEVR